MPPRSKRKPSTTKRFPLDQFLRRGQRRRVFTAIAALLIALIIIIADRQGWLLQKTADWAKYDGRTARVTRIIDGDTIDVDITDGDLATTRIRLWGIDTPETAKPREGLAAQPFADEAHARTLELCEGKQVTLKMDAHQDRDRYGRLLVYIILPDGTMLNEQLLVEGLARYVDRYPHQLIERFELLERQARFERRGMWRK